jgi:hypothetical protein
MRSENPRTAPPAAAWQQEERADALARRNCIVDHFPSPVIGLHASQNPRLRWHSLARREEAKNGGVL